MSDAPPPIPTPERPAGRRRSRRSRRLRPKGKLFPCAKCGAKVEFDPRTRSLKCPYCGHETKVDETGRRGRGARLQRVRRQAREGERPRHRRALDADALHRLRRDGAARRQGRDRRVPVLQHAPGEQARSGRRDAAARVADPVRARSARRARVVHEVAPRPLVRADRS